MPSHPFYNYSRDLASTANKNLHCVYTMHIEFSLPSLLSAQTSDFYRADRSRFLKCGEEKKTPTQQHKAFLHDYKAMYKWIITEIMQWC